MSRFEGKLAMVTGGGGGIGQRIALRMAKEGADLVILEINEASARATEAAARALGREVLIVVGDASKRADVERGVDTAIHEFGRLDIMVANVFGGADLTAARSETPQQAPLLLETSGKFLKANLDAGLTCDYLAIQTAAREMIRLGGGKILLTSSIRAYQSSNGQIAYCTAKAGVSMMTRVAALELAPFHINVNAICPGHTFTSGFRRRGPDREYRSIMERTIPWRRFGYPSDIAAAAAFLCSEDADYVTGEIMTVAGGLLLKPLLERLDAEEFSSVRNPSPGKEVPKPTPETFLYPSDVGARSPAPSR